MKVTKRDGTLEDINFNKIASRIKRLTHNLSSDILPDVVAQKVMSALYDEICTENIDGLSEDVAIGMATQDLDYEKLATRLFVSNLHKKTPNTFSDYVQGNHTLTQTLQTIVRENEETLNGSIKKNRDNDINFFGLKTLERSYLHPGETPQYMFMRVALGIHGTDLAAAKLTYNTMSRGFAIHATPTLFNAGTHKPQMSSCFLKAMDDDSLDGIFDTIKKVAQISKWAGGIGLHIHNVRSKNSRIEGTQGNSDGIVPMLRVINNVAKYVNQGGKRKGSVAIYLEPWHADIREFLNIRLNHGDEETRCRDLFTALWIPDLFMKRLEKGQTWSLFCPNKIYQQKGKRLSEMYGKEFEDLYEECENEKLYETQIHPEIIWKELIKSQTETGTPYMLYKDACNSKSNQKHSGIIKSSNLCTEILEISNPQETAVCNLASIALPKFVNSGGEFNFNKLKQTVGIITRNLNKIIDLNFYPVPCAKTSNLRHRPIGMGVQGLADVFMLMDLPFDSPAAKALNIAIFETMYYAALETSMELARELGPYETWEGSPASQGILQFDMWKDPQFSGMYNWDNLKEQIVKHGLRNSLLMAPMPTASTSQIMGNNECFEPYTTNIYLRRTMAGEFMVINHHLVTKLKEIDLWNRDTKDNIIRNGGSVQGLAGATQEIKDVFKTVWEISQKTLIDMARDRGAFICQSQSMNLFLESPTLGKISSMHMYAWKAGLKTGMYYLRSKAKSKPIQFTLEPCQMCSA